MIRNKLDEYKMNSTKKISVFLTESKIYQIRKAIIIPMLSVDCTGMMISSLIIYMKKLPDSDWLRAVQFKCNTVQEV